MFDMIDAKDQLRDIYGFIFIFVNDENLVFLLMIHRHGLHSYSTSDISLV